jgi:hypothetical protein
MNCELMLTYDTPPLRQTGSRNLTGQKTKVLGHCNYYTPAPQRGRGVYCFNSVRPSFRPSKIIFVAFFSVTVDGRNLIFGHKPGSGGIKYLSMIERIFIQQQVRDFQPHYDKNQFLFDKMVTMLFLYNHIITRTSFSLIRW